MSCGGVRLVLVLLLLLLLPDIIVAFAVDGPSNLRKNLLENNCLLSGIRTLYEDCLFSIWPFHLVLMLIYE